MALVEVLLKIVGGVHRISPGTCVLVVVLVLYTIVPPDTIQTYKVGYVAEMAVAEKSEDCKGSNQIRKTVFF